MTGDANGSCQPTLWKENHATSADVSQPEKSNRKQTERRDQTLRQRWLTADYAEKRMILEIVWLSCRLIGGTLCPQIRKPFNVLAEGLLSEKSGAEGS